MALPLVVVLMNDEDRETILSTLKRLGSATSMEVRAELGYRFNSNTIARVLAEDHRIKNDSKVERDYRLQTWFEWVG